MTGAGRAEPTLIGPHIWFRLQRPRPLEAEWLSDFGKHVEAMGELLRRSGDRAYAMSRVQHYQQVKDET